MVAKWRAARRVAWSVGMLFLACESAEAAMITFNTTRTVNPDEYRWSNIDGTWTHISFGIPSPNVFLPAFDQDLGTLTTARLEIDGSLLTTLFTHTGAPTGGVATRASATGHATLSSSGDPLFATISFHTVHHEIRAGDARLFNPYAEVSSTAFATTAHNQNFTGASLTKFLGAPIGYVAANPHPDTYFHFSFAPGGFFKLPDADNDGHPVLFGDAHFEMSARWDLKVIYTYESLPTVTPVPEPGSLALFGAGLMGVVARRRRLRRRSHCLAPK